MSIWSSSPAARAISACWRGMPPSCPPSATEHFRFSPAQMASLGVSLTLRGMARRLQFVTAHARKGEALDLDWSALADPGATLAVYMGKFAASDVARQLIAAGMPADTTAIVIENASLPEERHLASRLDLLPLAVSTGNGDGPALLLDRKSTRLKSSP